MTLYDFYAEISMLYVKYILYTTNEQKEVITEHYRQYLKQAEKDAINGMIDKNEAAGIINVFVDICKQNININNDLKR